MALIGRTELIRIVKLFGFIELAIIAFLFTKLDYLSAKWILMFIAQQIAIIQMWGGFDK